MSMVRTVVNRETDYELQQTLREIRNAAAFENGLDIYNERNSVSIRAFPKGHVIKPDTILKDTFIYLKRTDRVEGFRKLITNTQLEDQFYHIEISEIIIEEGDIISVVSWIIIRLFLFLTAALLIGNFLISKNLFRPFEHLLKSLDKFRIKTNEPLSTMDTKTQEFQRLNQFAEEMTNKARLDYQNLKEFSENASHEMQTPIAIAQGKLELLLESPDLTEGQLSLVHTTQQSINKISRLGQALTLLTKIDNEEFNRKESIDFSKIVATNVQNFAELAQMQGITLEKKLDQGVQIQIDPVLADILITNLLKNSLQHNLPEGWVKVRLTEEYFEVKNSGEPPKLPTEQLFQRFKKNNQSKGTLGLGLAIVKRICEVNGCEVEYSYANEEHALRVTFSH